LVEQVVEGDADSQVVLDRGVRMEVERGETISFRERARPGPLARSGLASGEDVHIAKRRIAPEPVVADTCPPGEQGRAAVEGRRSVSVIELATQNRRGQVIPFLYRFNYNLDVDLR